MTLCARPGEQTVSDTHRYRYDPGGDARRSAVLKGPLRSVLSPLPALYFYCKDAPRRFLWKEIPKTVPLSAAPSASEVEKYLRAWNDSETYRLQESALNKLFLELAPQNDRIENILIKAATLNDFYSANIFSIYPVARHILSLDIDKRLQAHDLSLVSDISYVTFPNGKTKKLYSFATKYCSHHKPDVYPIYDDYINKILRYYRDIDGFSTFTSEMLLDYRSFHAVLHDFQRFYKLESYTVKEIDQYLWQLGKANFPKKY